MKRVFALLLMLTLCLALIGCTNCAMQYEYAKMGDFSIGVNKAAGICFVGGYTHPYDAEDNVIVIPNDYQGMPITRIGGYTGIGVPNPFEIDLSSHYPADPNDPNTANGNCYGGNLEEFEFDFEYEVVEVEFVLQMGSNIEEIVDVEMDCAYLMAEEDGYVFYRPVVYIECAEDNPVFYSRDGMLYQRENDALITNFSYKSK